MKTRIKRLLREPTIRLCAWRPSLTTLDVMRRVNGIQLAVDELMAVVGVVRARESCNLLVFGLGNDSAFWSKANRRGKTAFLEDDEEWLHLVLNRRHDLSAYLVTYGTRLSEWQHLLDSPDVPDLDLPREIREERWDVVLVDGPGGWDEACPGRMKSIAAASRLARMPGDVFVHYCDRPVERACCERYLGEGNLVADVGKLRHYRVSRNPV